MNTTSTDFRIQESLNALGVKDINLGTSTGANSFANGPTIESFSPVDGLKIGSVICTSRQDYEAVMTARAYSKKKLKDYKGAIARNLRSK